MGDIGSIDRSYSTGFVSNQPENTNPRIDEGKKVPHNKDINSGNLLDTSADLQAVKQDDLAKSKMNMDVRVPQNLMENIPDGGRKSEGIPLPQVDKSNVPVLNLGDMERLESKSAKDQLDDIMNLFSGQSGDVDEKIFGKMYDFIKQAGVENKGKWWDINAAGSLLESYFKNGDKEKIEKIIKFANSPKFAILCDSLRKYSYDAPWNTPKERLAKSRVQHESSKIVNNLDYFSKLCKKYAADNKLTWNNSVSNNGQAPIDKTAISNSLERCWNNALAEVSQHMMAGSSNALRYGMYILSKKDISTDDLNELKIAIDSYYKNIGIDKDKIDMARVPFNCHNKISNKSDWQTILDNIATLKTDKTLSSEYQLFIDDLGYKISNKIAYDKEVDDAGTKIFGSDIAKRQFVKSNLGFSLLHWLKNLFTKGKTYSLNEENFRDNMRGFVGSLDNKERFELLRKINNGNNKEMLRGFIRDAIKDANKDMSDEKLAKYTGLAMEIFDEEFNKWKKDNPHLNALYSDYDVEFLWNGDQKDNMENSLSNFVRSVMFGDNVLEMGEALAKLYGDYMQVVKDDGTVVKYNKEQEFKALVGKLPVELKKAFIRQLADGSLQTRDNLNQIYAICLYQESGDTVKGINGQDITAFIKNMVIPAFCDIGKDNNDIRNEAQNIIEVYGYDKVNDGVSMSVANNIIKIIRDKRASNIG